MEVSFLKNLLKLAGSEKFKLYDISSKVYDHSFVSVERSLRQKEATAKVIDIATNVIAGDIMSLLGGGS